MMDSRPAGMGPFFSATLAQHLMDLLDWHGVSVDSALADAGLTRESLSGHGGWVPVIAGQRLLHGVMAKTDDPLLFLRLSQVTLHSGFGAVGYLIQACPTLKDAITAVARFEPLISDIGISHLRHEPGRFIWGFECRFDDAVLVRHVSDFITGSRYRFLRMVRAKRSSIVLAVLFQHAAPSSAEEISVYADVFHCPVHFGQAENAIVLNPQALNTPLRLVDTGLKEVIEAQASKKLDERQQTTSSLLAQAREHLVTLIEAGHPSRELLAEKLGISARHLHRQLLLEGSSYRSLLDELRLVMAQQQLRSSHKNLEEIGRQLGFSDGQSFMRWFRQVAGMTPGEFRQSLVIPAPK